MVSHEQRSNVALHFNDLGLRNIYLFIDMQTDRQSHSSGLLGDRADQVCIIVLLRRWSWKGCSLVTLGKTVLNINCLGLCRDRASVGRQSSMSQEGCTWEMVLDRLLISYTEEASALLFRSPGKQHLPKDRGLWVSRVVLKRWSWKGCSFVTQGCNTAHSLLVLLGDRAHRTYMIFYSEDSLEKAIHQWPWGIFQEKESIELKQ